MKQQTKSGIVRQDINFLKKSHCVLYICFN